MTSVLSMCDVPVNNAFCRWLNSCSSSNHLPGLELSSPVFDYLYLVIFWSVLVENCVNHYAAKCMEHYTQHCVVRDVYYTHTKRCTEVVQDNMCAGLCIC